MSMRPMVGLVPEVLMACHKAAFPDALRNEDGVKWSYWSASLHDHATKEAPNLAGLPIPVLWWSLTKAGARKLPPCRRHVLGQL